MPEQRKQPETSPEPKQAQKAEPSQEAAPEGQDPRWGELQTQIAELRGQLKERGSLDEALKALQPTQPAAPQEPALQDVPEEDFQKALEDGDTARYHKLMERQRRIDRERTRREVQAESQSLRQTGGMALASQAKRLAEGAMNPEYVKRFRKDLDAMYSKMTPDQANFPESYEQIYRYVIGEHAEELQQEAIQQAMVQAQGQQPSSPSATRGRQAGDGEPQEPSHTLETVTRSPQRAEEIRDTLRYFGYNGDSPEDQYAQSKGYKDFEDYCTAENTPGWTPPSWLRAAEAAGGKIQPPKQ